MNTHMKYAKIQVNMARAHLMRRELAMAEDCLRRAIDGLDSAELWCEDISKEFGELTDALSSKLFAIDKQR